MSLQNYTLLNNLLTHRIYGKSKNEKRFKAMNLKNGTYTGNLIYASVFTEENALKVLAELISENSTTHDFEIRKI